MTMMTHNASFFRVGLLLLVLALVVTACDATEPEDDGAGEEEIISNVTLTLTNEATNSTVVAEAVFDEAGVKQSADTVPLAPGATYSGTIELRNRFEDEDITEEIAEEADEHQFFYVVQGDLSGAVTVTITDADEDGLPVGLEFNVVVAEDLSGTGTLRVVLGHYDERPKEANESVDAIPETDIDFTYPVRVE